MMFQPDEDLIYGIDTWIEKNRDSFVRDLDRLVSIPSISENGSGDYPFGKKCGDVLDEVTSIAEEYGFSVENHEYYCGSCLVKGTSAKARRVGLFAHLDVVPFGEGWQYPPNACTEKDGFLIGRGVGDNKGPGICALYALRYLKEHGIRLNNDILLYFGLSEETGMEDIEYFCKTRQVPDFCLVTDTNFPVCYGEKGLLRVEIQRAVSGNLVSFQAGTVINVIPSKAEAVVSCVDIKKVCGAMEGRERITVTEEGGLVRITASGISKHAAFPEGSVNAVNVLAQALSSSGVLERGTLEAAEGIAQMTADYYGAGCQIPFEDKESGRLTCVGSLVSTKDGIITVSFDIRYPVTVKGEEVLEDFEKAANGYGFTLKSSKLSAPAYVSPNHPYIPVLCGICDYVQEKHYEPYTMGGGTYSRHLPLAVGFGPGIPDAPNPFEAGHGQGHQPDECIKEEILLKGLKTYIIALIELDKIL